MAKPANAPIRAICRCSRPSRTEALRAAVPVPNPASKRAEQVVQADVPSPLKPPPGCHFHTRCPYMIERCKLEVPALREVEPGHHVACHLR